MGLMRVGWRRGGSVGEGREGEFWILNFEFLIEEGIAHTKGGKGGKPC